MAALFLPAVDRMLSSNSRKKCPEHGFSPVVKIHGGSVLVWLLTHHHPRDKNLLFGLCDAGIRHPMLRWAQRDFLEQTRLAGLGPLRMDPDFTATHPVGVYALAAKAHRRITDSPARLAKAQERLDSGASANDGCCSRHLVKTALWAPREDAIFYEGRM